MSTFRLRQLESPVRLRRVGAPALAAVLFLSAGAVWIWREQQPGADAPATPAAGTRASREEAPFVPDASATPLPIARWENESVPPLPAGNNAADFYKNAFALFDQLSDEEKEFLRNRKKKPTAEQAAALLEKIQPILELLRTAAQMPECDWAVGPPGPDNRMPHLSKAMNLAPLVRWAAEQQFSTDPDGALDNLLAAAHLGRQMPDTIIGLLMGKAIDSAVVEAVRLHLGSLPPATADRVGELLKLRAVEASVREAFQGETTFLQNTMEKLQGSKEQRDLFIEQMSGFTDDERGVELLRRLAADPAALQAEADYVIGIQEQMGETMLWPEARYQAWWKQVEAELKGDRHPLAKMTLPTLHSIYDKVQYARIQSEMLAAARAVIQSGPDALAAFRDPATEQSFMLLERPDGFELQSTFIAAKKPVTMFFPTVDAAPASP